MKQYFFSDSKSANFVWKLHKNFKLNGCQTWFCLPILEEGSMVLLTHWEEFGEGDEALNSPGETFPAVKPRLPKNKNKSIKGLVLVDSSPHKLPGKSFPKKLDKLLRALIGVQIKLRMLVSIYISATEGP